VINCKLTARRSLLRALLIRGVAAIFLIFLLVFFFGRTIN
jgi:hypothetical protein